MGADQSEELTSIPDGVVVYNRFIRVRNVLLSEVDMAPLFKRLQKHREEHGIHVPEPLDSLFHDLLAAITLHGASRPRNELLAWTIRYADPVVSYFFGADTELGTVVGRFFDQNVKEAPMGEMHQELHRPGKEPHRSMIEFDGKEAASAINQFYEVSEQRPAFFLKMGGTHYALVSAHPDYDEGWFTHLNQEIIREAPEKETLNLLEKRQYYWLCGCSHEKIMDMLAPMMKENPAQIFGNDDTASINCPRCTANYTINRAELQAVADKLED